MYLVIKVTGYNIEGKYYYIKKFSSLVIYLNNLNINIFRSLRKNVCISYLNKEGIKSCILWWKVLLEELVKKCYKVNYFSEFSVFKEKNDCNIVIVKVSYIYKKLVYKFNLLIYSEKFYS